MLNYDLTFLALLLNGLYEPETKTEKHRCIPHPLQSHPMVENEAISYAADMCVLLSYQKLKDDWEDERKAAGGAGAALLKKSYRQVSAQYPRQKKALEENIKALHAAEQDNARDIDYVAGLNGRYLAELFVWKDDLWQEDLRIMGFFMGKFIYLMDAVEDLAKDKKRGNYNVFSDCGEIFGTPKEEEIRSILTDMMTEAARAFERLPVLENAEIIRNILYSGVWCRYAAVRSDRLGKQQEKKA
jgi:predicted CopG family antitoxin